MSGDLLQTKLYVPRKRPSLVPCPPLIEKLNKGLHRKLTLISAPAGFGKTTLITEWIANCERPFAWFSLDGRDSDITRFLTYFIATVQTLAPSLGTKLLGLLGSAHLPSTGSILTALLNEIAALTSVGMFGQGGGWEIPVSNHTLQVTLGGIAQRPALVNGQLETRQVLCITISFDHDIVDGAPVARFAQSLKELIEGTAVFDELTGQDTNKEG